jgi:ABC-type multidrug transport system ATPase subunit
MPAAIATLGLTKDYGGHHGLFDLDLEVAEGTIFGFLGPNGAGKSTAIRLLMGLIHPTRGRARILGLDCHSQSVRVKRLVGYLPGELPEFGSLRGSEIVTYMAGLRGDADQRTIQKLAERFDLDLGRRYREYSHGNKQKLAILLAFMHNASLLILDEPTNGLDPLNQQEFYSLVRETRAAGASIFFSSHVLSEVEHICDQVGIIRAGELASVASLHELHGIRVHQVEVEFDSDPPDTLHEADGVSDLELEGRRVRCTIHGDFEPFLRALAGGRVVSLTSREPSLEEIFLSFYETRTAANIRR